MGSFLLIRDTFHIALSQTSSNAAIFNTIKSRYKVGSRPRTGLGHNNVDVSTVITFLSLWLGLLMEGRRKYIVLTPIVHIPSNLIHDAGFYSYSSRTRVFCNCQVMWGISIRERSLFVSVG